MRINELARELEVKAKVIIDFLPTIGVEDKRSHSSSLEPETVEKVKKHFAGLAGVVKEGPGAPRKRVAEGSVAVLEAQPEAGPQPEVEEAEAKPARSAVRTGAPPAAAATPAPSAEPVSMPRPAPAPRAGASTVLRPPMRKGGAPGVRPLVPPLSTPREALAEALPASVPVLAAPPQASPAATEAPAGAAPSRPFAPLSPPAGATQAPAAAGRASLVAGAPAPGTVPPGTIIRQPGQVPVGATGARPAGRPIYQRRPGLPGAGARPGAPSRPGAPARTGAPAAPGPAGPGRRPMHPTRARPAGIGPGLPGAAPPAPTRARRPGGPVRERERPLKRMPPVQPPTVPAEPLPITRSITITEGITVKELAEKVEVKAKDLMQQLIRRGVLANINQALDNELAIALARHFGAEAAVVTFEEQATAEVQVAEEPSQQVKRPPVVTIMGHVDHGKTSLLDAIRQTSVTEQEAGGITQHIGAYQVEINERKITFIDTPGHEAFTRMRSRGAKVTDVVVLVVAADDGVMPQTLEAMDHARAAKVPIVVAINKVDKPEALPERVKKQLADRGVMPEDWGGDTVMVEVSAKQHKNLDLLMEMILLVSDMQELKANPDRPASGVVLEAKLDRGRGPVATVLVQNGTLRAGDPFIVGPVFSKVRAMMDDRARPVEEAPPSTPVEVLGLASLPQAGDYFQVITDVLKAKQTALYREQKLREQQLARSARVTLEELHAHLKAGEVKELPIILKADVHGSAEVLAESLAKLSSDKVKVKIIHSGVGAITESDVLLASASNAVIIGFNVRPERKGQDLAAQEGVDIRLHTIIYEVTDEIRKALEGLLEPTVREIPLGRAEVRQTFRISKVGTVAGCYVQEGRLTRGSPVRLVRDAVVVYTGKIGSLRRFKDDVNEVKSGFECGVSLENFADVKPGDVLESFVIERVAAALPA